MRATVAQGEDAAVRTPPQNQRNAQQHGRLRGIFRCSVSVRNAGYQSSKISVAVGPCIGTPASVVVANGIWDSR